MLRAVLLALLLVLVPLTGTGTAVTPPGPTGPTSIGQALVGFHADAWPGLEAGDTLHGLPVLDTIEQLHVAVVAAADLRLARLALAGDPGVAYVEDDGLYTASLVPDDPLYPSQYGPAMMGFPAAWTTVGYGSSDVTVAVVDSGILRTHEDLAGLRVLQGKDLVNGDPDPNDDCGHGTHVAGTLGATTDNGKGVAGMAQVTILPVKVLQPLGHPLVGCSGSASDISQGIIDSVLEGADIVSMSLGGAGSTTMKNAADWAYFTRGVLVVAAAGNDGSSNSVDCPACYSSVIAVAALDATGNRASYSDAGPEVEISAPGSDVWSTTYGSDTTYGTLSGTSMATPHVSGALALALTCKPTLTASGLRGLMQTNAQDKGTTGRDDEYGYGLLRVDDLITAVGTCPGANNAPSASFTTATSGTTLTVDAGGSSDPDGDPLGHVWDFGDGTRATGETARHTYTTGGTYTVTLTVSDGHGGKATASTSVGTSGSRACGGDPEPLLPETGHGDTQGFAVREDEWVYRKLCVPSPTTVQVTLQDAGLCTTPEVLCPDADLYVRAGALPDEDTYDCRSFQTGSNEACTVPSTPQWLIVGVHAASGRPEVTLTVTGASGQPDDSGPGILVSETSSNGRTVTVGAVGDDPEGDPITYSWTFGDGGTGTGALATYTYASAGTYTVTATASDGRGQTGSRTTTVTVGSASASCPAGPSGGVHVLEDGRLYVLPMREGDWHHRAVCVDAGDVLDVVLDGDGCPIQQLCDLDADVYVRAGSPPTTTTYDCRPFLSGSQEACSFPSTTAGWYYVSVNAAYGEGTAYLTATRS